MLRPERRRRRDLVAAASIIAVLLGGAVILGSGSDAAGTSSMPAQPPITAPPQPATVPAAFAEAWRAPSAATPLPVVAGPAAVTADGSTVTGHDALTGDARWTYRRDLPLCTAAGAFPAADGGQGRVLALYREGQWCSELTALRPDTGARAAARNPDVRPGTRLVGTGTLLAATGTEYLEVMRSDLVRTLEYGEVPAPEQAGRQPRTGCVFGSVALMRSQLGVVQTCPDEAGDRLSVLDPDSAEGADSPQEQFSVPVEAGAIVVALSPERTALALPGSDVLALHDPAGAVVASIPLDTEVATPPDGIAATSTDDERIYWWTGSHTVALDRTDLAPLWTLTTPALGPPVPYADTLLVPVPGGLLPVDPVRGTAGTLLPVDRADPSAPVRATALGEVLLEQRGTELVALRPGP